MDLRDRCREILSIIRTDGILRQHDPVDTLVAFVTAETGRGADTSLGDALPLCLYFRNREDREEFIAVMRETKPEMITKSLP